MVGTLKGPREKKEDNTGVEIFPFLVLVIFWFNVYTTHKILAQRSSYRNSGARAVPNGLRKIKENNKQVRGIWTSAVTQALTPRPWQFHESKRCCLGFSYIKQNQHLSWESEQWCWQVHRANDNTIAEMRGTTVPPTLLKDHAFKHHHWTVKPLKPLSCPYCPFYFSLK